MTPTWCCAWSPTPGDVELQDLWQRWDAEQGRPLAAPTLFFYEVTNALYRYQRSGVLSVASVRSALKAALALPLQLVGEAELHGRALGIAKRFSLPAAYDAHYLAAAQWLGGELWDGRCTAGPRGAGAAVGASRAVGTRTTTGLHSLTKPAWPGSVPFLLHLPRSGRMGPEYRDPGQWRLERRCGANALSSQGVVRLW